MAMGTRRRHQGGNLVDQRKWRQYQRRRACAGRCSARQLGVAVDQMRGIALVQVQVFEGERRRALPAQNTTQESELRPVLLGKSQR